MLVFSKKSIIWGKKNYFSLFLYLLRRTNNTAAGVLVE